MGSQLAPLLSDVCINWLIDQSQKIGTQPVQLYRYVDDCFATFEKRAHITEFYKHLNSIHPNIQFTYELAQHNQLAFLDVWISNQDGKLALKTYRKPTHCLKTSLKITYPRRFQIYFHHAREKRLSYWIS